MTRVAMVKPDEMEWRIAVLWCDGEREIERGGEEERIGPYQRQKV